MRSTTKRPEYSVKKMEPRTASSARERVNLQSTAERGGIHGEIRDFHYVGEDIVLLASDDTSNVLDHPDAYVVRTGRPTITIVVNFRPLHVPNVSREIARISTAIRKKFFIRTENLQATFSEDGSCGYAMERNFNEKTGVEDL